MNSRVGRWAGLRVVAALATVLAAAGTPSLTYAQHAHGGGGGFGGGAHFGGGGGGHSFGGGGHVASGGARAFAGGGHFAAPHIGGVGYATRSAHAFAVAPRGNFVVGGTGHPYSTAPGNWAGHVYGGGSYPHSSAAAVAGWRGGGWHEGGWHTGGWRGGGWGRPGYGWHHGYWGGGYWHGTFWPHVYYRTGFTWFLPVLPLGCAAYYWGGVPYYYWDDLYYTWSPENNGYVVTDPPPAAADSSNAGSNVVPDSSAVAGGAAGGTTDVYIYPRNGQSDEQTANDRYECHKWAVGETGFDPTRQANTGSADEYRRAMMACLDARGYSAN